MKYFLPLAIIVLILIPAKALAWGKEGHVIVAAIAEENLTDSARKAIAQLGFASIATNEVANYADKVRRNKKYPQYASSAPWHFIDLPYGKVDSITAVKDFSNKHKPNVLTQIDYFSNILRSARASKADKQEALKFLVHFVGDIHQPLHCVDRQDHGGNSLHVHLLGKGGKSLNLHHVWDTNIVLALMGKNNTPQKYGQSLSEALTDEKKNAILDVVTKGVEPSMWAYESYCCAVSTVYKQDGKELPRSGTVELTDKYLRNGEAAVKGQLEKAGVRLADLLNNIFDDDYYTPTANEESSTYAAEGYYTCPHQRWF